MKRFAHKTPQNNGYKNLVSFQTSHKRIEKNGVISFESR